jgi:hypothetical protein
MRARGLELADERHLRPVLVGHHVDVVHELAHHGQPAAGTSVRTAIERQASRGMLRTVTRGSMRG